MAQHGLAATLTSDSWDKYLALVQQFPLRRIRSEEELDRAIELTNALLDRDLDPWEQDYLDVLDDLIERYETAEHPIDAPTDAELLQHLIEARGATPALVAAATGIAESTISAVVRGKRKLAPRHREPLARFFHVSPAVFASASGASRSS